MQLQIVALFCWFMNDVNHLEYSMTVRVINRRFHNEVYRVA